MAAPLSDSRSTPAPNSLSAIRQGIAFRCRAIEKLSRELEDLLQQESEATIFRFLDLPRELRDFVYECAVAPSGKVFPALEKYHDARVADADKYEQPQWQLLAVNHQIRAEAAEIMFAQNHIVVNYSQRDSRLLLGAHDKSTFRHMVLVPKPAPEWHLCAFVHQYLTSLSLALDVRSSPPIKYRGKCHIWTMGAYSARDQGDTPWLALDDADRVMIAHDEQWGNQRNGEEALRCAIECCVSLRFLQLDLTKCFCPMGCCRAVGMLAANLKQIQFGEKMTCLEVLKCINAGERKMIIEALTQPGLGVEVREGMEVQFRKWEHPEQRVPMRDNGDFRAEECSSDQEVILHDARESMGDPLKESWAQKLDRRHPRTAYLRSLRRAENA